MTEIELESLASEAYENYWLCVLDEAPSTSWNELPEDMKKIWCIVVRTVLLKVHNV